MRDAANETAIRFPVILLPRGGYVAVLMEAYMDESRPKEGASPYIAVGGYLFSKKEAETLSLQWSKYLAEKGLDYFRMSECATGNGQFDGWAAKDRIAVQTTFIQRIKQRSALGFSVSVDEEEHDRLFGDYVFGTYGAPPSAYGLSCFACLNLIKNWADRQGYAGDIAYLFEAGDPDKPDAHRFLDWTMGDKQRQKDYRYAGHSFALKEKVPLLQTGDLVSWHTVKHCVNQREGRTLRKDLKELIRPGDMTLHADKEFLRGMRDEMAARGNIRLKNS